MSWQRPNHPLWREVAERWWVATCSARSRARVLLCMAVMALGCSLAVQAQSRYALIGQSAPDFALHAAVGGNARLSEHRGEVVVLSFWSSRCTPCRTQLAALNRSLATYHSAGLAMFGIGVDDDPAQAREFARSASVSFALLLDPAKGVSRSYQVDNLPMTVLIDRSGTVRNVLRDYSPESEQLYLQQLRALLNE
ncbi:MAG: TlpA family protein disulfide reductase [Gammaproteobacteria bacterium]|nr:MAG: TlpA family protein disulfide reductase [Gammaproteobacteria bacterium]TLZ04308.1 MAG: TlpA family protein disulfide reductase [Gammaproteobacteria bacterium]